MSSSGAAPHSTHSPTFSGRGGDRTKADAEIRELRRIVRERGREIQELRAENEQLRGKAESLLSTAQTVLQAKNIRPRTWSRLSSRISSMQDALDGGGDHDA